MKRIKVDNSISLWEKAVQLIPCGTQSFSKGPTQFSFGVSPVYLKKGNGAKVTDIDDNEYIDYGMGLHSVILGYARPEITNAITEAAQNGNNLTLMHPLEVEVAQTLSNWISSAEMLRFTKTGSEAVSAAVRIARIVTGRDRIATCGYHGWHDWFIGVSERCSGVPDSIKKLVQSFSYNQIESLEKLFTDNKDKIAAVIMEPCGVVPPNDDFLNKCKQLAHKHGALFILDEIITGMRWHEGGAQKLFNVIPDISTFGKSIANGMPLSIVVGKKEYMEVLNNPDAFISSSFAGEIVSLAACKATLKIIKEEKVVPLIWERGENLMKGFNKLVRNNDLIEFMEMVGYPCRPVVIFKENKQTGPLIMKSYMQQECAKRGLLFTGYFAMSLAHTNEIIASTLNIFEEVLKVFRSGLSGKEGGNLKNLLEGEIVSPVFRKL
ncbi:MAG TPA: aminotransferase class III-fold pyridoxal phosphate-dependent enzyme [Candidatus Wujingus californicus]|uniref:aminotransferase class III-fold pyridoxal phosphate-dependent enzyme n=1 Tax=Candidatus Wujingus californicus TaxID=3367618 RepID=UPI001DB984EF|nr:aminotransferase class III-fold pyridoxal phosphate-dependent enzyme [Planctomycetota bacterium]MDO8131047.1 aminotransferase class III-fold pyridoxal phosphate-dependent enzyme [Candidatus Brocadiales bacterium]